MNIEQEALGLAAEELNMEEVEQQAAGEQPLGLGNIFSGVMDLFRVETGPGDISDYIDLPLNFDHSEGLAQVLRGASGFIGANFLRSAILDLVVGFWRWSGKGGKPNA